MLDIDVEYTQNVLFRDPQTVTVTVAVPPDADIGGLTDVIDGKVQAVADRDVAVRVHYVLAEQRG